MMRLILNKNKKNLGFDKNTYLIEPNNYTIDYSSFRIPMYNSDNTPVWIDFNKIGTVKTVNGQEPNENGDIPLDLNYVPLTGTEEGKPLEGTIEVNIPYDPLFKNSNSGYQNELNFKKEEFSVHYKYDMGDSTTSNIIKIDDSKSPYSRSSINIISESLSKQNRIGYKRQLIMNNNDSDIELKNEVILRGGVEYWSKLSLTEIGAKLESSTNRITDKDYLWRGSDITQTISNFPLPTNWTNSSQRFSGLVDKSADATYNKVMVLDDNGNAGMKNLDYAIPYVGANKAIDLNTQRLTIGGDFNKSFSTFDRSHLAPKETGITHFTRLTDVASFSRGNDNITQSDCIVITLPIRGYTQWVMEVDIHSPYGYNIFNTPTKLIIGAVDKSNSLRSVNAISGADNVKSVSFGIDSDNNTVIIIRPNDGANTKFSYGKVNIANFYHSAIYNADLAVKSNYKVEAALESSFTGLNPKLTGFTTITNAQFNRDPYLLDFRNFTNVPKFAQASNVFAKNEATNWTNSSQRFSGLVDKSADATYNKVMVLDSNGNAGMKNLNADTLIDILTNSTPKQINQIKTLLGI